ncbi:hypothetical protein [Butyrivibrio sp. AE2032]|uniref:hypothetical protein n=1 Tax=Butyrivibrio sp. AE2032 TaxID=1458463 RepID=UPI000555FFB2|nr:hypothetical protein [Butyrivibrio sp. AE2032]
MKKFDDGLFRYNLQFFGEDGEGTSETTQEVAEPETADADEGTEESTDEGVTEDTANPPVQSEDANRAFANMRRQMEAAQRRAAEIDAQYARQFGNLRNPETGQPIRGAQDYFDALAAQERMAAREQLKQNNVDPSLIDKMIANSPVMRQAQAATAELNNIKSQQLIEDDVKEVMRIDPTLSSREDFFKDPSVIEAVNYIQGHPGMRLSEAYKIVNFDRLSSSKTAAAKQAVINQVKGQSHLANGNGLNVQDTSEDIPANMLDSFKDMFPDKSMKELKVLYNKTLQSRR